MSETKLFIINYNSIFRKSRRLFEDEGQKLLPKKRSRVSTRTEEFEYEPARRGRTRRDTKKSRDLDHESGNQNDGIYRQVKSRVVLSNF